MSVVMIADGGVETVVARMDAREPDLAVIDGLLRWRLVARRRGWCMRLRDVPPELHALLELVGVAEVLALEPRRQSELGEQLGEDEVVQRGDLPA
jgi:hypothetical protein